MAVLDIQDALALLEKREALDAAHLLEQMIAEMPAYATAHVLLARSYEALYDWDRALAVWRDVRQIMPNSPVVRQGLERAALRSAGRRSRGRLEEDAAAASKFSASAAPAPSTIPERSEDETAETSSRRDTAPQSSSDAPALHDTEPPSSDMPPRRETTPLASDDTEPPPRNMPPEYDAPPPRDAPSEYDEPSAGDAPSLRAQDVSPPSHMPPREHMPPRPTSPQEHTPPQEPTPPQEHTRPHQPTSPKPQEGGRPHGTPPPNEEAPDDLSELHEVEDTGTPHYEDLDRLINELESARIVPRPDLENVPSPDLDDDIEDVVSETLARIYASQGQYDEAARVYELLAGQHPEESDEYLHKASQMRSRASDGD